MFPNPSNIIFTFMEKMSLNSKCFEIVNKKTSKIPSNAWEAMKNYVARTTSVHPLFGRKIVNFDNEFN